MHTVSETPVFQKYVESVWTESERTEFINWIAANPLAGDVIPDSEGCRKVRWSRAGMGKRGGARVIYFKAMDGKVWLLIVYAKSKLITCLLIFWQNSRKRSSVDKEMEKFQNDLLESVRQMNAGQAARTTVVQLTAAADARAKVGVSQSEFASLLGVSVRTLQDWEQGRRTPSGAAKTLLQIASRTPEAVRAVA